MIFIILKMVIKRAFLREHLSPFYFLATNLFSICPREIRSKKKLFEGYVKKCLHENKQSILSTHSFTHDVANHMRILQLCIVAHIQET